MRGENDRTYIIYHDVWHLTWNMEEADVRMRLVTKSTFDPDKLAFSGQSRPHCFGFKSWDLRGLLGRSRDHPSLGSRSRTLEICLPIPPCICALVETHFFVRPTGASLQAFQAWFGIGSYRIPGCEDHLLRESGGSKIMPQTASKSLVETTAQVELLGCWAAGSRRRGNPTRTTEGRRRIYNYLYIYIYIYMCVCVCLK